MQLVPRHLAPEFIGATVFDNIGGQWLVKDISPPEKGDLSATMTLTRACGLTIRVWITMLSDKPNVTYARGEDAEGHYVSFLSGHTEIVPKGERSKQRQPSRRVIRPHA